MKKMKYIFTFLLAACFLVSCDDLSMNETIASAPVIENFAPAQGSVGSKIVVTGKALNGVTTALLGEKECEIVERLSNTSLTIEVPNEARTGKITLVNAEGEGVSESEFAVEYPAPLATASSVQTDVEMGNKMLISGKNMNVITAVYLTADGGNVKHEASVISKNANEIVFTVPYVEKDDAHVTFTYFDGTATQETSADLLPMLHVKRYQPVVTTTEFGDNSVGDEITLSGSYLNKINKVFVGDVECMVSLQTENTLKFVVPNSDNFVDGHNETSLSITYFDGIETRVLTEHFGVNVPFVYFWKDKVVYGQGRDVESLASFFSPETGLVYANSLWTHAYSASGGYKRSDGGTDNSDFEKGQGFGQVNLSYDQCFDINAQVGISTQSYGANTFYSAKYNNQYEKTDHGMASLNLSLHNQEKTTIS